MSSFVRRSDVSVREGGMKLRVDVKKDKDGEWNTRMNGKDERSRERGKKIDLLCARSF